MTHAETWMVSQMVSWVKEDKHKRVYKEYTVYEFQVQTKLMDSERISFCWWMGVLMTEKGH